MIHKFEAGGVRLVLDVNSGAVHVIDKIVWDLLDYGPDFVWEDIVKGLGDRYPACHGGGTGDQGHVSACGS